MRAFLSFPALAVAALVSLAGPSTAQGELFAPRVFVNDRAITNYEFDQRLQFLKLLQAPPEMLEGVEQALIDDRLRQSEATRLGIVLNDEQINAGMEEFANRANLGADQFVAELEKVGIAAETFRDFVSAGLLWREVVRARYGNQMTVTESDLNEVIATALPADQAPSGPQVMVSELIVRREPDQDARARLLIDRIAKLTKTAAQFDTSARQFSTANSRDKGGKLEWMPLSALPESVRGTVSALKPGEISKPVQIAPGTYAMFLLHERKEAPGKLPEGVKSVEYAQIALAGGRSAATLAEVDKIRAAARSCKDLYGVARGNYADRVQIQTSAENRLPADVARELASLDPGESSAGLVRGDALVFLMLCNRSNLPDESIVPREQLRAQVQNQRLVALADMYLAELRESANIRHP